MDAIKNFASAFVSDGNYDASTTEIDLITGHGDRFPVPPFNATWWNVTDYPNSAHDPGKERVRVTGITGDTLTITRAQEGTSANDKNVAGKTYAFEAGPSKKTIDDLIALLGDVFGSGTAILVSIDGETIELRQSATKGISVGASTVIQDASGVDIGDPNGAGNSAFINISDSNQRVTFVGMDLATTKIESATIAVGTLAGKLKITNEDGSVVRYLPLYSSIT
jgi:hypothetical protein